MKSSITDKPIKSWENDFLDIQVYANALANFMKESDTPLTIGMQGEWGSGKTSLMYLVQENLKKVTKVDGKEEKIATAWINTWEYSIFRDPAETAPAILTGMLENLKKSIQKDNEKYWAGEGIEDSFDKVIDTLKGIGKTAFDVILEKTLGTIATKDIKDYLETYKKLRTATPVTEVAENKQNIQKIINKLIQDDNNPYKKVVFFVDDLDRLEPSISVEILEGLKNLFDVDNCIFVLAIDYDVVIKGLEKKYGKKTAKNEHEFRSFFDKIIQVPFSMPLNAYNVERLLIEQFKNINFDPGQEFKDFEEIVFNTVENNPRSIKRYINTFSLLKRLIELKKAEDLKRLIELKKAEGMDIKNVKEEFCLFTLVGIQIAFPGVYKLIIKNPQFLKWGKEFAYENDIDIKEEAPEIQKNNELSEKWEQIIRSFCNKDAYLKTRTHAIIRTLDLLREKIEEKDIDQIMQNLLQFTNLTSRETLEPSPETKALAQVLEVAELMLYEKKEFTDSVKIVKDRRKIGVSTVTDKCTRQLDLTTKEFKELIKDKNKFVEFLINNFPESKEVIEKRLNR